MPRKRVPASSHSAVEASALALNLHPRQNQAFDDQTLISVRIRNIGILCAALVVMIHSNVYPTEGTWQARVMSGIRYVENVAVPFFFMVSGYFLAVRMDEKGWWSRAVRKRIHSLVIPFWVWQMSFLLFNILLVSIGSLLNVEISYDRRYLTMDGVYNLLGVHPFMFVNIVWYLRAVFFFVLISPLLTMTNALTRIVMLIMTFAIYVIHEAHLYDGSWYICFENFFPVRGLFFFFLGINMQKSGVACIFDRRVFLPSLILFLVLLLMGGNDNAGILKGGLDCCGVLAMLVILFNVIPSRQLPAWVYELVVPVYLIHLFVLMFSEKISKVLDVFDWWHTSLVAFFVKIFVAIGASCVIAQLLRRYFQRFSVIAFGGR